MFKIKSKERIGELYIIFSSIVWSLFPILIILSYSEIGPLSSLAWTTLISSIFFFILSFVKSSWKNILRKEIIPSLLGVILINGIFFYVFYYFGLKFTGAGNASIIATMEIFFSFLLFNIWKKEYIQKRYIIGIILMFIGAIIILSPNFSGLKNGDFLILFAVFIVPFGNHLQKKIRNFVSSEQILFYRTLIATPLLFFLAFLFHEQVSIPSGNTLYFLLFNGVIIGGLTRIFWLEGIYKISITKAISLASISPIFTIVFSYIILKEIPTHIQILAVIPSLIGVYLLTRDPKIKND